MPYITFTMLHSSISMFISIILLVEMLFSPLSHITYVERETKLTFQAKAPLSKPSNKRPSTQNVKSISLSTDVAKSHLSF